MFGKKKQVTEGSLRDYEVIYLGGHPDYPKKKSGSAITFSIMPDSIYLHPTITSEKWFKAYSIPYSTISKLEIVQRTVSTAETLLGGVNSRQLNQANNIQISYTTADGKEIVLRLEMLTGITVMGQATKCNEMMDFLRENSIMNKFKKESSASPSDVTDQIKKLSELHDQGILTDDEFNAKKKQLLGL